MAVVQNRIDQNWLEENRNDKANQPFFDRYTEYVDRSIGIVRSASVVKNLSKLRNALGTTHSEIAENLEKTAGATITGLGLVRLPRATSEAYSALSKLNEEDGVSVGRKTGIAIRDTLDAIMCWSNAGVFFTANPALRQVSQIADLGCDTADLTLSVNDYYLASSYEEAATGEVKEAFAHTRKYLMLRVAKAVLAVAAAIFTFLMILTGITLIPVVLGIFLSLTTTFLAIGRDLYKDMGTYRLIDMRSPLAF